MSSMRIGGVSGRRSGGGVREEGAERAEAAAARDWTEMRSCLQAAVDGQKDAVALGLPAVDDLDSVRLHLPEQEE